MPSCAALNCISTAYNDKELIFHRLRKKLSIFCSMLEIIFSNILYILRFPKKDPERLKKWLSICPDGFTPHDGSRLCSKHFPGSSYWLTPKKKHKKLMADAYPQLDVIPG